MLIAIHVVIFFALNSHVLEGAEASDHGASDPSSVLTVQISRHDDIGLNWSPSLITILRTFLCLALYFLLETLLEARKKSCTTSKDNIVVEVNFKIVIAFLNGLEGNVGEATDL